MIQPNTCPIPQREWVVIQEFKLNYPKKDSYVPLFQMTDQGSEQMN